MKIARVFSGLTLILVLPNPSSSFAEGRCPPGQYPIGSSQGLLGCAPIPGAQQSQQGQGENDAPLLPPQPTGRWYSRFGALVQSKSTSVVGLSADKESAEEALADARMMCGSEGARDCETVFTYSNQCTAWLVPSVEGGGNLTGVSAGKTIREAEKNARKLCKDVTGKKCKTFYSACSKPVFEKF
ncbi:DUF4189 domain-containing protein [Diaphorobacter nitroreducens]|uniref:DUF4189 domain-containing protein n=1 Tax=Diaphorobacter nitroreducens TaxID=164759 RepID=UPI0028B01B04|nr:DUF4189 domain-containing protein [Diaphorobacter nitroreducens]